MRVVILAAGSATRLRPLTDHCPKCLLPVGARTILSRAVQRLAEHGLRRFTLVDGFYGDALRAALTVEYPTEWFSFVRNEAYATTNNAYSLWLALKHEPGPFLLLDSDVLFDSDVIAKMLGDPHSNRIAVRNRGELGEEEIKVTVHDDGRIADLGKTTDVRAAVGESVGIELFSAEFAARLFATLERRMRAEKRVGEWYEASFVELIDAGEVVFPVYLDDSRAMEVDTLEDLERARQIFG